jgi:hypothetical protein
MFLKKIFPQWMGGRAKTNPPNPHNPRDHSWRDDTHAIDAHLDVRILPRAQDKHALTAANWVVDVLFQTFADGF